MQAFEKGFAAKHWDNKEKFLFFIRSNEESIMLTKTKTHIRIPMKEWETLRLNPNFSELIEFLEDRNDLQEAKKIQGKDMTLQQYLKKRGLRNHS